jgi:hypothetical protein
VASGFSRKIRGAILIQVLRATEFDGATQFEYVNFAETLNALRR